MPASKNTEKVPVNCRKGGKRKERETKCLRKSSTMVLEKSTRRG